MKFEKQNFPPAALPFHTQSHESLPMPPQIIPSSQTSSNTSTSNTTSENTEYLEEYSLNGSPTGRKHLRRKIHEEAIPHVVVHVWILDSEGHVLAQQRSLQKRSNPGKWDLSAAGHVDYGEDLMEAARRETQEEIGVKLSKQDWNRLLKKRFRSHRIMHIDDSFTENEFMEVFVVQLPERPSHQTQLQEEEVLDTAWIHWKQLKAEYENNGEKKWVPLNEHYFHTLFSYFEQLEGAP